MLATILSNYGVELIFGLVSAGLLAFCKHLHTQNKELKRLQEEDKNRQYREMILSEIEPIIDELTKVGHEMSTFENSTQTAIANIEANAVKEHKAMYKDLDEV